MFYLEVMTGCKIKSKLLFQEENRLHYYYYYYDQKLYYLAPEKPINLKYFDLYFAKRDKKSFNVLS